VIGVIYLLVRNRRGTPPGDTAAETA